MQKPWENSSVKTKTIEINTNNLENFILYWNNNWTINYWVKKLNEPKDIIKFINENPNWGFEYHDKMNSLRYSFKEITSSSENEFKILCHLKSLANQYETNMHLWDIELTLKVKWTEKFSPEVNKILKITTEKGDEIIEENIVPTSIYYSDQVISMFPNKLENNEIIDTLDSFLEKNQELTFDQIDLLMELDGKTKGVEITDFLFKNWIFNSLTFNQVLLLSNKDKLEKLQSELSSYRLNKIVNLHQYIADHYIFDSSTYIQDNVSTSAKKVVKNKEKNKLKNEINDLLTKSNNIDNEEINKLKTEINDLLTKYNNIDIEYIIGRNLQPWIYNDTNSLLDKIEEVLDIKPELSIYFIPIHESLLKNMENLKNEIQKFIDGKF